MIQLRSELQLLLDHVTMTMSRDRMLGIMGVFEIGMSRRVWQSIIRRLLRNSY